jgi:phosphoribulokinase
MLDLKSVIDNYSGILLDIDNTIFNYSHSHKTALRAVLEEFDFSISDYNNAKDIVQSRGLQANHHKKELYFKTMCEESNANVYLTIIMYKMYTRIFNENMLVDKSMFDLIKYAKSLNKKIIAVTNYYLVPQIDKLTTANVIQDFDGIVTSEEFEVEKPSTKLFDQALKLANLNRHEVVMIGDSRVDDTSAIGIDYYPYNCSKILIAIAGKSGAGKSTIAGILNETLDTHIIEGDGYHKYERHDSAWKRLTHYNPEANNLIKLAIDIQNVYQNMSNSIQFPIYDHKDGTFFDSDKISNNDINYCIIDGLHSLYNEVTNEFVKVKIYVESDEADLQKVARDSTKRDSTAEKVLASIKTRSKDYDKYIANQKDLANIVISKTNGIQTITIKDSFNIDTLFNKLNLLKNNFNVVDLSLDKSELHLSIDLDKLQQTITYKDILTHFFKILFGERYV